MTRERLPVGHLFKTFSMEVLVRSALQSSVRASSAVAAKKTLFFGASTETTPRIHPAGGAQTGDDRNAPVTERSTEVRTARRKMGAATQTSREATFRSSNLRPAFRTPPYPLRRLFLWRWPDRRRPAPPNSCRRCAEVGFGGKIPERRPGLDRLIDVLQRFVPVLIGGVRVRGLQRKYFVGLDSRRSRRRSSHATTLSHPSLRS